MEKLNVPPFEKVIEDFKTLSRKIGKNAVALRYDPILINEEFTADKHIEMFDKFAKSLKGYTEDVTISFLDLYDNMDVIPFDKIDEFLKEYLK